jgi:hypothetical protein
MTAPSAPDIPLSRELGAHLPSFRGTWGRPGQRMATTCFPGGLCGEGVSCPRVWYTWRNIRRKVSREVMASPLEQPRFLKFSLVTARKKGSHPMSEAAVNFVCVLHALRSERETNLETLAALLVPLVYKIDRGHPAVGDRLLERLYGEPFFVGLTSLGGGRPRPSWREEKVDRVVVNHHALATLRLGDTRRGMEDVESAGDGPGFAFAQRHLNTHTAVMDSPVTTVAHGPAAVGHLLPKHFDRLLPALTRAS